MLPVRHTDEKDTAAITDESLSLIITLVNRQIFVAIDGFIVLGPLELDGDLVFLVIAVQLHRYTTVAFEPGGAYPNELPAGQTLGDLEDRCFWDAASLFAQAFRAAMGRDAFLAFTMNVECVVTS